MVIIVRASDKIRVVLGDDDVSQQRKLPLVAGRHRFRIERNGASKDVVVEVLAGKTFTLDAAR